MEEEVVGEEDGGEGEEKEDGAEEAMASPCHR